MTRRTFRLLDELLKNDEGSLEGKQKFSIDQRKKQRERLTEVLGLQTHKRATKKLPHYKRKVESKRDKFGNRLFNSERHWYFDNESNEITAGLLISPEGEKMIQENKDILHDIERGILIMMTERQPGLLKNKEKAELGNNRRMSLIIRGGQSQVYLLETSDKKYIIKLKAPVASGLRNVSQPYVNEMLQQQTLAHELKNELDNSNISLASFMFASGQVSCTEFAEGDHPTQEELAAALSKDDLRQKLTQYLEKKISSDPLWKDINFDLINLFNNKLRTDNFIKRKDNSSVWIDPFYYNS